jgi:biopolymer transport protein ExbD
MAEIAESGDKGHGKKGKKRAKKSNPRIDMTPMVDLAFLLLTFFVLTSTFSKPKVMSLVYPAKLDKNDVVKQPEVTNAITFLLSKDKVFYYTGKFYSNEQPGPNGPTQLTETDFGPNGLRKLLNEKNEFVLTEKRDLQNQLNANQIDKKTFDKLLTEAKKDNRSLKVLIKTDDKTICKNFIDLIDELKIADIGIVAPIDDDGFLKEEKELLKQKLK